MAESNVSLTVSFDAPIVPFDPTFNLMVTDSDGLPKRAEGDSLVPGDGTVAFEKIAADALATLEELNVGAADKIAAANIIRDFLTKRQKHDVRDYGSTIFLNSGTPSTAGFQAACTEASDGYPLHLVPGEVLLDGPITVGESFALIGPRAPAGYDPEGAAWIHFDHTGKGILATSISSSSTIQRIGFRRTQPPVVTGEEWTPNACDWDLHINGQDVCVSENMFLNATKGMQLAGIGRLTASHNKGQFFEQALEIRAAYDRCNVDTLHAFPFWSQAPEVRAYMEAHLRTYRTLRNDGAIFSNLFSIWHSIGLSFGYFAGDGPNLPPGVTRHAWMPGCYMDAAGVGIYVEPEANGVVATLAGFVAQGADTPKNVALMELAGNNSTITMYSPRLERSGAELVKISGTGNVVRLTDPSFGLFGLHAGADAAAGLDAGVDSNRIDVAGKWLQDETVTTGGEVRSDTGPRRAYSAATITNTAGTYANASLNVDYRKGLHRAKIDFTIGVTDAGDAAGYTQVTIPFATPVFAQGTWTAVAGIGSTGGIVILPGTNIATFRGANNEPTPFPSGAVIAGQVEFEISE